MKKLVLTLGMAAVLPLAAQAESYLGASLGTVTYKASTSSWSTDNEENAAKIYGGYKFSKHVGAELGYVNMSRWSESPLSVRGESLYAAATGTLPLSKGFALHGKLGIAANQAKARLTNGMATYSDTYDKSDFMYGIGASYAFTPALSGVVEYEDFGKLMSESGVTLKANMVSVGLKVTY